MNKKILISLCVIAAVAAIGIGGTIAYFSDTETSTGNTFTAGELDLIVDINGQDQNPLTQKLFDLSDMKPGDKGEVTVSLKVDNNPACGKVSINVTEDLDNSCTEPEGKDENKPTAGLCDATGELNDAVNWMIWLDQGVTPGFQGPQDLSECDNDYVEPFEQMLVSGPLTGSVIYSIGELPVAPSKACYGVAYCFGAWNGAVCNGAAVNNASQSDSFKADLIIEALQKRNQFTSCPEPGVWDVSGH
jgi:predicted ribosomally synthesized peptide with SipW-like signal peptide